MNDLENKVKELDCTVAKLRSDLDKLIIAQLERNEICHEGLVAHRDFLKDYQKHHRRLWAEIEKIWDQLVPAFEKIFPKHSRYVLTIEKAIERARKQRP